MIKGEVMKKIMLMIGLLCSSLMLHPMLANNLTNKASLGFYLNLMKSAIVSRYQATDVINLAKNAFASSDTKQAIKNTLKNIEDHLSLLMISSDDQRAQSAISKVINRTSLYYEVVSLDDNQVKDIIHPGTTDLHLPLNGKGYELRPYENARNGVVVDPITADEDQDEYNRIGGNLVIDAQALSNIGVSVAQTATPLEALAPRSHAVALWPSSIHELVFATGMPVDITIELDNLSRVPDLVFPRITQVVRKGLTSMPLVLAHAVDFNRVLAASNFTVATQNITKENSVTGANHSIPTSGDAQWLWTDIPNS